MVYVIGIFCLLGIVVFAKMVTISVVRRNLALRPHRNLINYCSIVWLLNALHRALIWVPSLNGVGGYDGTGHERIARVIAGQFSSGRIDILEMDLFSNTGYRNFLGIFYAITDAPNFVTCFIHAMLAFLGLLFCLEAVAIATKQARLPWWFVCYVILLPSAMIFTPWILKEAPALWGIGLLLRFGVAPEQFLKSWPHMVLVCLGGIAVFLMRPHIGGAWMLAIAASRSISFRKPILSAFALLGAIVVLFLTLSTVEYLRPGFNEKINEVGLMGTLDGMTANAQGGSALYRETTPIPVLNGLIFVFLEPNPLYWGEFSFAIVGVEAWFITLTMVRFWSKATDKARLLMCPEGILCLIAILALAFYLGYMYNMGLMVRQRLQVMPALFLLAALPLRQQGSRSSR